MKASCQPSASNVSPHDRLVRRLIELKWEMAINRHNFKAAAKQYRERKKDLDELIASGEW